MRDEENPAINTEYLTCNTPQKVQTSEQTASLSATSAEDTLSNTQRLKPNLILIGFMGVGKSRIGPMCARRLGYEFRDSDQEIEARVGCSVAEYFAREGEAAFREHERRIVAELTTRRETVIATGGGTVLDPENVARLRDSGMVILLAAPPRVILQRVGDTTKRPLLADCANPLVKIQELLAQRTDCYERSAHYSVSTARRTPGKVTAEIIMLYGNHRF